MVAALAEGRSEGEILAAVEDYLEIGGMFDEAFAQQAEMDVAALERAVSRTIAAQDRGSLVAQQHQALRWTFLGSGMTHPEFLATLGALSPAARARVESVAPAFA